MELQQTRLFKGILCSAALCISWFNDVNSVTPILATSLAPSRSQVQDLSVYRQNYPRLALSWGKNAVNRGVVSSSQLKCSQYQNAVQFTRV